APAPRARGFADSPGGKAGSRTGVGLPRIPGRGSIAAGYPFEKSRPDGHTLTLKETGMNVPHSFLMIVVVVAVAALFPLTATAQPPTTVLLAVNDVQVFAGADSPCPFDVTFTGPERSSSQPTTTTAARRSVRPSTAHSPT